MTNFIATQFSTPAAKEKFAKHFKKFCLGGFQQKDFPKWFYTRLSMCFSHIAHYNQGGFYDVHFATAEKQRAFLTREMGIGINGDPAWTYSDVERHLQDWMQKNKNKIFEMILENYDTQKRAKEAEAKRQESLAGCIQQTFRVAARSQGIGSFGHYRYIVVAKDGSAWEISISSMYGAISEKAELNVELGAGKQPKWSRISYGAVGLFAEVPRRLPDPPAELVKQLWG